MKRRPRRRDLADDLGASAAEYALLVVAVAAILVLVVFAVGRFAQGTYSDTCDSFESGADNSSSSSLTCP